MSNRPFLLGTALAAALAASSAQPARAQSTVAPLADSAAMPPAAIGPSLAAAPAAVQAPRMSQATLSQEQAALQARARKKFSHDQVLMIVGSAAVLTGLLAGGGAKTVLVIGGTGIALFGLYRYLQ